MSAMLDLRDAAHPFLPAIPNLPHLVESARLTWRGRMINEYGSAHVFEAISVQLRDAGYADELVDECAGFADEERTHGILCGAVVESLGGEAFAPALPFESVPEHADVSRGEAVLRNLISVSCMSETVAVSLIGAERVEMPPGALRDLLTKIYADEIGHARFGWRIVNEQTPKLDSEAKRKMSNYLRVAFGHLERHELAHLPAHACPPPEGVALGLCSGSQARELFYATVDQVIVPQLEALGLSAKRAWETRIAA
jgi:hypothetical protein